MAKRSSSRRKGRRAFPWWRALAVLALVCAGALVYLDAEVRSTLQARQWQQPAQVYARPLELAPGRALDREALEYELRALGYRFRPLLAAPGDVQVSGDDFWIYSRGFALGNEREPARQLRVRLGGGRIAALWDANGRALERARLDPLPIGGVLTRHAEDRELLRLDSVPRLLPATVLLVEDRYFYHHWGLSPRGIARAMWANIRAGRLVQGGSTVTQQLVKNVFFSNARSLWRKALEVPMALLTELHFSKSEILELYLNEVYLGQEGPRAIHGLALAARHYFNRPLGELSHAQLALLVGMIKGPAAYAPWRYPARARERRDLVLTLMARHGLLSEAQYRRAVAEPLGLAKRSALEGVFPAYLDLVRRQLHRDYEGGDLQEQGLKIVTSFDPVVQWRAERALAEQLQALDPSGELEAAMVVTDVHSGDVVALVGGRRMKFAGFNRALDAVRPVGSLIKPAVFLAALRQPERYTLVSRVSDGPVAVQGADGSLWQPRNFDRREHGDVALHAALAHSYNQATARLGMELGLDTVIDTLRDLGLKRDVAAVPSLLLGTLEMSPLEVAGLYQTLATQGRSSSLRSIRAITDADGRLLARYPQRAEQTVEPEAVHLLHYALQEVVREGTGAEVYQRLPADFAVAGKTGTTDDQRDSWFAGFAGDYLAVVWLGRDNNRPTKLTGSTGALKVWREFMARASGEPLYFAAPEGIEYHWVDSATPRLADEHCAEARYMPFIDGSAPRETAPCRGGNPLKRWFRRLFD